MSGMNDLNDGRVLYLFLGLTVLFGALDSRWQIPSEITVGLVVYVLLAVTLFTSIISYYYGHRPNYDMEAVAGTEKSPQNITVSKKYYNNLLSEVQPDEKLVWALEPMSYNLLARNVFFGAAVALPILWIFQREVSWENIDSFLSWICFACGLAWVVFFPLGVYFMRHPGVLLYGVTNKRVFELQVMTAPKKDVNLLVYSCDYKDLLQISMTRLEDGSGTLTFSTNKVENDPASKRPLAFENLLNVAQVKELIESNKNANQTV